MPPNRPVLPRYHWQHGNNGMALFRLAIGAVAALVITTLLLVLMQSLIQQDELDIDDQAGRKIADIQMGKQEIETRVKEQKPDKPDEPDQPPPPPEMQQLQDNPVNTQAVNVTPTFGLDFSFGDGARLSASDGEYLPIVKVPPEYPRRALSRGIEGYCVVEYTVTKTGSVRDPKAVDCDTLFETTSIQAALKFKYKPRVENGEPVEVHGVRNMFTYKLAD